MNPTESRARALSHLAVHVADVERSLAFYRDLLGMEQLGYFVEYDQTVRDVVGYPDAVLKTAHVLIPNSDMYMEIIEFVRPQGTPVDPQPANPGTVHLGFFVDDLEATLQRLIEAGYSFHGTSRPVDIPASLMDSRDAEGEAEGNWMHKLMGGKACYVEDPDGIVLQLDQANPSVSFG